MYKAHGLVNKSKFFRHLRNGVPTVTKIENKRNVEYVNLPCAFDIETSSFYYNMVKCACMYNWQFGIDGYVVMGRTWDEFIQFMDALREHLNLSRDRRLVIYVHNLPYEFQWIKDRFTWYSIFAREKRKPMKAVTNNGFEFRCSYILSGASLAQTAKDLVKYKTKKMVGDLDYDLVRSPKTPLTKKEIGYCVQDIVCVMNYIQEEMEAVDNNIVKIPMTKTGKVRRYCRTKCLADKNYNYIMRELTINGSEEYDMLKRAFSAGFTHANYRNAGDILTDVTSKDFTSSYPATMVCDLHPMSHGEWVRIKSANQINLLMKDFYLIFNVEFKNIREKEGIPDHYISHSKCFACENVKADNGRIISADRIQTTINSDDWFIINKVYDYDEIKIGKCLRYRLGYLPRPFVQCVLDFYKGKTTLKNVPNKEAEYQLHKQLLNSTFGMAVTDIVNPTVTFKDEWDEYSVNEEKAIEEYNKSKQRFLFYPWGISICSKARRNLWTGILELGEDYIYSDTDSVKYINAEKHEAYFLSYNLKVEEKMKRACEVLKLNFEDTRPKTVKGEEKPLGVWDDDGEYLRFKTLGAKRYLVETKDHKIKSTIAGANKIDTSKFIASQENPFEFFNNRMSVDKEHSGRLIHGYIDNPFEFELTDYLGNHYSGSELSAIHMEKSEYNLTLTPTYSFLLGFTETKII